LIFRGLFFSHNDEIGQKDHFWMGTNYEASVSKLFGSKMAQNVVKTKGGSFHE